VLSIGVREGVLRAFSDELARQGFLPKWTRDFAVAQTFDGRDFERRRIAAGVSGPPVDRESPRLIADAMATTANGTAEREVGLLMLHAQWQRALGRRRTVGVDKAYDVPEFIDLTRELGTTPHIAQKLARPGGAIDGRSTRNVGYAMSQHARPRIEPAFDWLKTIAWIRKVKLRGLANVEWRLVFVRAAFNLIRLPKLLQPA
jgi:hypothetical protein